MNDIETLTKTGDCYRLLAACFYEPDRELFIEQQVCENLCILLESAAPEAAIHAEEMRNALSALDGKEMAIDYAALFVGPFELPAPPYGSIYLEGKREVMGDSTMEVARFYQDIGLEVREAEPPDHIAIELEFLALLCSHQAQAQNDGDTDVLARYASLQTKFFSGFFDPWISSFCQAVAKSTDNSFYLALARTLERFTEAEKRRLQEETPTF